MTQSLPRSIKPELYPRFVGTDVTFYCTMTNRWTRVRYYGQGVWNVQPVARSSGR